MCFEFDASPPDLPPDRVLRGIAGGAAAESLVLTSSDGNRFAAALAESPEPRGSAVVVLPDVRGLYRFYVELVERLAEAGHHAIALDYFGRTAGAEERDEDFDFSPEVSQTRTETVQLDLAAARSALAERTGATSVVSLGFCFGGTHSFFAGTNPELGLDGVIGFYGLLDPARVGKTNRPNLLERGAEISVPVLGLFGGADRRSRSRTSRPSTASSIPPASSTRSSPIPAHPTPSSTNRQPSTPRRRGMPGTGSSTSSANRPPELRSRSARTPCRNPQSDLGGHR